MQLKTVGDVLAGWEEWNERRAASEQVPATEQDWTRNTFREAEMARMNKWWLDTRFEANLVKFVEFWTEQQVQTSDTGIDLVVVAESAA